MSEDLAEGPQIRLAFPSDLPQLVGLCAEHAAWEQADFDPTGLERRLEQALFVDGRLRAWVIETCPSTLEGFATVTVDFSTWSGRPFWHLDCLYLHETLRGRGQGRRLMALVFASARRGRRSRSSVADAKLEHTGHSLL